MHVYFRGDGLQRLRLASGLVLLAFAATHFLNHAVGLLGLEAMHQAQELRTAVTRSWPGTTVLVAALVTHIGLALYKLARRETWRMPPWEAVQIGLGLAIPFLLFPHIVNTRISHVFFGVDDSYLYELVRLWPDRAVLQSLLLLAVWTHGCIGLHFWLRLSTNYGRIAPVLLAVAMGLPLLALAGFAVTGRTAADIMSDAQALQALKARSNWPNAADSVTLAWLRDVSQMAFAAVLAAIALLHLWRYRLRSLASRRGARVSYFGGPTIELQPPMTLLEASRAAGVRHASVCGGRARCSTCRVRIEQGLELLPPPTGAEAITLESIGAPANVRLACQLRPSTPLTVTVISNPATPGPIQVDFLEIKDVVAAHVRASLAERLVDMESPDADAAARWFRGKLTYRIAVRPLAPDDFALVGARLDYLLDRPAAALVYMRRNRPISVFVLPAAGFDALAIRGQRNGYHVLAWADAGYAFFATTDLPADELDRLENALTAVEVHHVEASMSRRP